MDLEKYLASRNISQKECSEMLGVSLGSISKYISGYSLPRLDIAIRIETFTKGKVSVKDLLSHWEVKKK